MFDVPNWVKWLVALAVLTAAILLWMALGDRVVANALDPVTHFFHTMQGSIDAEVPGNGASPMSPQTWAKEFVLKRFSMIWIAFFGVFTPFIAAVVALTAVRLISRVTS